MPTINKKEGSYRILDCVSAAVLEAEVVASMAQGWTPVGGVALGGILNIRFYQTMVMYK